MRNGRYGFCRFSFLLTLYITMTPTLILYNGNIYTQQDETPHAIAVAIEGNRIVAVGDDVTIRALAGVHTVEQDLHGFLVLPGLVDSHIHFYAWAVGLDDVLLWNCASLSEMLERIRRKVASTAAGEWVRGSGWVETEWNPPVMPHADDLDAISTEHPIIVWRTDNHSAVANHRALEIAGITRDTPNPPGGIIQRDENGDATGRLFELAIALVAEKIPLPSQERTDRLIKLAQHRLHHMGITGVHDQRMKGHGEGQLAFRAYQRLLDTGDLHIRMTSNVDAENRAAAFALGLASGMGNERFQIGHMKTFMDGSLGSQTAWMVEPFEGTTDNYGIPITPIEEIHAIVREAQQHGFAVSIHAIGDRANREVLDVFEELYEQRDPAMRLPHRIEHVQTIQPEDLPRLAKMGIVASVQPIHATDDYIQADRLWGARGANCYNFRSLLNSGAVVAFGSDCPVADPNPFLGIYAAVTRQRKDGLPEGGWYPDERLTVAEAVYAYTVAAHQVVGRDNILGRIAPGYLADMIVVDRDIFTVPPREIVDTVVEWVVFDGELISPHL
jgi:predicted amidohydrolase YtcJ